LAVTATFAFSPEQDADFRVLAQRFQGRVERHLGELGVDRRRGLGTRPALRNRGARPRTDLQVVPADNNLAVDLPEDAPEYRPQARVYCARQLDGRRFHLLDAGGAEGLVVDEDRHLLSLGQEFHGVPKG
jgi:hypothetical protein